MGRYLRVIELGYNDCWRVKGRGGEELIAYKRHWASRGKVGRQIDQIAVAALTTHYAGCGAGGSRVEPLRHTAGKVRFAAGDSGVAHGFGHEHGVLRFGNGGVHEDAVRAQLHGFGGVRGRADSGVDDKWDFGNTFAKNTEIGRILDAQAGADWSGKWHNGGSARIDKLASRDQIIVRVRQHDKTFFDQDAGGLDVLLSIREERLLIPNDFQLDPVGEPDFAAKPRGTNGLVSGVTARSVRQDKDLLAIDKIEQRFLGAIGEIHAAHRHSNHVRARSSMRAPHVLKAAIFP